MGAIMTRLRLTQLALARRCGVDQGNLSNWLSGHSNVKHADAEHVIPLLSIAGPDLARLAASFGSRWDSEPLGPAKPLVAVKTSSQEPTREKRRNKRTLTMVRKQIEHLEERITQTMREELRRLLKTQANEISSLRKQGR